MASVNSYSIFQLNVSGSGIHAVYSTDGSGSIATVASIIDDNDTTNTSTNILGDTPYDSFSVTAYTSASTQGGLSNLLTDLGGIVPLLYRGFVTSTYQGVVVHALVGQDTATGTYFLYVPTGVPDAAFANQAALVVTKVVVGTGTTEWQINQEAVFCFLSGTMLLTPCGERAVESLQTGDLVLTASGLSKPIRWVGTTVIARRFADRNLPIRILAGALDENVPSRDLLVSPGHGILVDGLLVHAAALVNGKSIMRETDMPPVFSYVHVELDSHELILAENTPAESFLEAVSDMRLDSFPERASLPGVAPAIEMALPRVKAARQLPQAVRATIAARAELFRTGLAVAA